MPAHILARLIVMRIRWIQRAVITYTIMWKQYNFDRAELGAEDAYSKLLNSVIIQNQTFHHCDERTRGYYKQKE